MFELDLTKEEILTTPLNNEILTSLDSACEHWRNMATRYEKIFTVLLSVPLIIAAPFIGWVTLGVCMIAAFGLYVLLVSKIPNILSQLCKVSLKIDGEQFARPTDKNLLKAANTDNQINPASQHASLYLTTTSKIGRKLTNLDLDIIDYFNQAKG